MASRVHVQRTPPLRDRIIDLVETEFGRHVTVTEIVERLGVPRNSVLKAIQRGGFPAHIKEGGEPDHVRNLLVCAIPGLLARREPPVVAQCCSASGVWYHP